MAARRADHRPRAGAAALALTLLALLASCILLASCAQVEPPLGGPEDLTPPQLLATVPDSGAVGLADVRTLELLFSEKVALVPAERLLRFYPELEVAKTRWQGRRRLVVELAEPLPADTVVVVELPAAYKDNHGVAADRHRTLVLATLDSLPSGSLRALVTLEGEPAGRAALELLSVPADTAGAPPAEVLRRASAPDSSGVVALEWLVAPGGPWRLKVYNDDNGDGRAADTEPQRLWPGTWSLSPDRTALDLGVLALFRPSTPGRLLAPPPAEAWPGALLGWPEKLGDDGRPFAPEHARRPARGMTPVAAADTTVWPEAGPGLTRLILFADLDGDSVLSALPDSSAVDTVTWTWEPFAVVDSLDVEPGRPLTTLLPAPPDTTVPCLTEPPARPAAAVPDSLAAALSDSLTVLPGDSLAVPAPQPEED